MVRTNPFRPSFGTAPHTLVGRDDALARLRNAMSAGPTHPDFTMLISSPRGSGKTVLLKAMCEAAADAGWVTVPMTATPRDTLSEMIAEEMVHAAQGFTDQRSMRRVSSFSLSVLGTGGGIALADQPQEPPRHTRMLRTMEMLGDLGDANNRGVLMTMDEFHKAHIDGAREFAHALQSVSRVAAKPVMFVGAGLPVMEATVLADDGMTFFQRIARIRIKPLTEPEAMRALRSPIVDTGSRIDTDALEAAAQATSGYPFMVQLVGYHSWEFCSDHARGLSLDDVGLGVAAANRAMEEQVLKPVWRDLSDMDRQVLITMSRFPDSEIKRRDLVEAMGKGSGYLSTYLRRLDDAGVIYRPARGLLGFVHAAMRNWLLRDHAEGANDTSDEGSAPGPANTS